MVSAWNQWLVPAPMRIMDRPFDSWALAANSRPIFSALAAGTPVISSCQAGVHGDDASSYPLGQVPGSPGRPTPYCASSRSKTVVTVRPATCLVGTPRRMLPADPSTASNLGSVTAAVPEPSPAALSCGDTDPRCRFQRPSPSVPKRNPSAPFGTTGSPVVSSSRTVLNCAFSE